MSVMYNYLIMVLIPLLVANVLHMLIIKQQYFKDLETPIKRSWFGAHKTWRGLIIVPILTGCTLMGFKDFIGLDTFQALRIGLFFGSAYMLFELPNSFIKRRLGIPAGGQHSKFAIIFSLIDKLDSALGVCLVYWSLGYATLLQTLFLLLLSSAIHAAVSYLLVRIQLKKSF